MQIARFVSKASIFVFKQCCCISLHRYGGIIPYYEDLDVLVDGKHIRSEPFLNFLNETKRKYGYMYVWRKDLESFSVDYSHINDNGIGFWAMRRTKKGLVRVPNRYNKDQPYANIYPPRKVNFSGVSTFVPNKPKRFCDIRYGKNRWKKELRCVKVAKNRKCLA